MCSSFTPPGMALFAHRLLPPTANFIGPTLAQRGSCRLHVGPTWAQRTLLSGTVRVCLYQLCTPNKVSLPPPRTNTLLIHSRFLHACCNQYMYNCFNFKTWIQLIDFYYSQCPTKCFKPLTPYYSGIAEAINRILWAEIINFSSQPKISIFRGNTRKTKNFVSKDYTLYDSYGRAIKRGWCSILLRNNIPHEEIKNSN